MRYALTLAYNGTLFLGSQIQKESKNTVFGNLEHALLQLGIDSKVIASGRTDKGVHASAQVCHFDVPEFWNDTTKLQKALQHMLPSSIQIKHIKAVDKHFHARYSAKKRLYRYILKKEKSNPFLHDIVTFVEEFDFVKIQKNIQLFVGEHDFQYFMKTGSDNNSSVRIIYKAFAYEYKGYTVLTFEANGFLRSQIRLMVAALLDFSSQEIQEQLSRVKQHKLKPAPSNGLYLAKIKY